jgi:hypothetical protein
MKHPPMTRRSFLSLATAAAFLVVVPGCGLRRRPVPRENESRALARMARLFYPHDDLTDDLYAEVLQPLWQRADEDPALATALREGLEELDRIAGQDWRAASAADQIGALARMEGGPFFTTVQDAVRQQLYEHPDVWRLIGYEGSSVEHGGYLHRGFDDIDWLPEA